MCSMKALIFHGTMGSPDGNWFPWLQGELTSKGWGVDVPVFPTPEEQSLKNWIGVVQGKDADLLIGHSLGATLVLRLTELKLINPTNAVLVSPVIQKINNEEYDLLNSSFINDGFDWDKIKSAPTKLTVLHGDDDPYVPVDHARQLSDYIDAPLHIIKNGGHLNADAGYTQFSEILYYLP